MGTVLVVDDTALVRNVIARIVRRAGYNVVCAANGMDALRIAKASEIIAAVVDYQMPGMDGLTLLSKLRGVRPSAARLLVSGALDVDVVMRAVNRGEISAALHKPVTASQLAGALDRAVASRELIGRAWLAQQDESGRRDRRALEELLELEQLDVALQPIVSVESMRPVAFEALLRPRHAALDGPEHVLRVAEACGRISDVGAAVAKVVARRFDELPAPVRVFVNLHPKELLDADAMLAAYAPLLPFASRVVLEITERGPLPDDQDWRQSIAQLRAHGFRIAVDDLGSGAASLSALAEIDPDIIKLDMSLIRGVHLEERKRRLVNMLARFGDAVGIEVVAEGIETPEEHRAIASLGVHMVQGYWLGRPSVQPDDVARFVHAETLPLGKARAQSGTRAKRVVQGAPERRRKKGA